MILRVQGRIWSGSFNNQELLVPTRGLANYWLASPN